MLDDLKRGIWSELRTAKPVDIYRRNLQKLYVERLIALTAEAHAPANGPGAQTAVATLSKSNDGLSIIKGHMRALSGEIRTALLTSKDASTKLHLQDLADRLTNSLDTKK